MQLFWIVYWSSLALLAIALCTFGCWRLDPRRRSNVIRGFYTNCCECLSCAPCRDAFGTFRRVHEPLEAERTDAEIVILPALTMNDSDSTPPPPRSATPDIF